MIINSFLINGFKMRKIIIFSFILFSMMIISCSEDGDFIIESSRIGIEIENEGEDVKITWNHPRMENLYGYVIVRTTEEMGIDFYIDIANSYARYGNSGIGRSGVIANINSVDVLEYIDQLGPIKSEYYYKLIAYNNYGHFVMSNTVQYLMEGIATIEFIPDACMYSALEDRIVLCLDDNIYIFDCKENKIVAHRTQDIYYSDRFCIGNNGFGDEIYVLTVFGKLQIFDFDLNLKHSINVNDAFLVDVTTDNNGLLFVKGENEYEFYIYSINRENLSVVGTYTGKYDWCKLACFTENNELIEIEYSGIYSHSYDYTGSLSFNNKYLDLSANYRIIERFPDGSKFLLGNEGFIIESSLDSYTQLNNNPYNIFYNDFAISTEYIFGSINGQKQIDVFDMFYNKVDPIVSEIYPRFISASDEMLYVVGTISNYYPSTWAIQKIPLRFE